VNFSFRQVRYFIAAAEAGQFAAAAAKVHVTHAAIAASIRQLEQAMGVELFARHHASGVSLTVDGHRFLQHAYHIVGAVQAALRDPELAPPKFDTFPPACPLPAPAACYGSGS
jgi:DNA-binding transcriptional LysR family regulator